MLASLDFSRCLYQILAMPSQFSFLLWLILYTFGCLCLCPSRTQKIIETVRRDSALLSPNWQVLSQRFWLVYFSVAVTKYLNNSNLRKNIFSVVHSSRYNPSWQGSQGRRVREVIPATESETKGNECQGLSSPSHQYHPGSHPENDTTHSGQVLPLQLV